MSSRFRQSNSKKVVKDLADIKQLIPVTPASTPTEPTLSNNKESNVQTSAHTNKRPFVVGNKPQKTPIWLNSIGPEDNIPTCIVKIMFDRIPRSMDEIVDIMRDYCADVTLVRPAVAEMVGRTILTPTSPRYIDLDEDTLVANAKYDFEQLIAMVKMEGLIDDPALIIYSEGVDRAIWKILSSGVEKFAADISRSLIQYGFTREEVEHRLKTLMRSKLWLNRNETRRGVLYSVKKNCGIAMATKSHTPVSEDKLSQLQERFGGTNKQETKPTEEPVKAAEPEAPKAEPIDLSTIAPVTKEDHWRLAIWKVTADRKQYSVSDIFTLLPDHFGNTNRCSAYMSNLWAEGWFDRVPSPTGKSNIYTLKEGIAMPPATKVRRIKAEKPADNYVGQVAAEMTAGTIDKDNDPAPKIDLSKVEPNHLDKYDGAAPYVGMFSGQNPMVAFATMFGGQQQEEARIGGDVNKPAFPSWQQIRTMKDAAAVPQAEIKNDLMEVKVAYSINVKGVSLSADEARSLLAELSHYMGINFPASHTGVFVPYQFLEISFKVRGIDFTLTEMAEVMKGLSTALGK